MNMTAFSELKEKIERQLEEERREALKNWKGIRPIWRRNGCSSVRQGGDPECCNRASACSLSGSPWRSD